MKLKALAIEFPCTELLTINKRQTVSFILFKISLLLILSVSTVNRERMSVFEIKKFCQVNILLLNDV